MMCKSGGVYPGCMNTIIPGLTKVMSLTQSRVSGRSRVGGGVSCLGALLFRRPSPIEYRTPNQSHRPKTSPNDLLITCIQTTGDLVCLVGPGNRLQNQYTALKTHTQETSSERSTPRRHTLFLSPKTNNYHRFFNARPRGKSGDVVVFTMTPLWLLRHLRAARPPGSNSAATDTTRAANSRTMTIYYRHPGNSKQTKKKKQPQPPLQ